MTPVRLATRRGVRRPGGARCSDASAAGNLFGALLRAGRPGGPDDCTDFLKFGNFLKFSQIFSRNLEFA
jgi:hypothetical protein